MGDDPRTRAELSAGQEHLKPTSHKATKGQGKPARGRVNSRGRYVERVIKMLKSTNAN